MKPKLLSLFLIAILILPFGLRAPTLTDWANLEELETLVQSVSITSVQSNDCLDTAEFLRDLAAERERFLSVTVFDQYQAQLYHVPIFVPWGTTHALNLAKVGRAYYFVDGVKKQVYFAWGTKE